MKYLNAFIDWCVAAIANLAFWAGDDEYKRKMDDIGWTGAFDKGE